MCDENTIKKFMSNNRSRCFALSDWKNLKMKNFSMVEMLHCICKAANGSVEEMGKIIDHLTAKDKVQGRTQVYGGGNRNVMDIIRNENGELELRGYNPDKELPRKGQHLPRNPKIFRKTDDQVNKTFQKAEERLMNLGELVRELYPGKSNEYIKNVMEAICEYAAQKKIHPEKVVNGIRKNRYKFDEDLFRIVPNVVRESKKRHVIVINESDFTRLSDISKMTEQKFHANVRRFISQLLADPVNTKVPDIFALHNITRSALLAQLLGGKDPVLFRKQKISDRDENGQPKTATMMVKFICPKKNFDKKLQRLFIKMFEKNLPPKKEKEIVDELNEDGATGCCGAIDGMGGEGARGGACITSMGVQKRSMPTDIKETTATTNVGNYEYPARPLGDKKSCARHNGEGGSISINYAEKEKKQ